MEFRRDTVSVEVQTEGLVEECRSGKNPVLGRADVTVQGVENQPRPLHPKP